MNEAPRSKLRGIFKFKWHSQDGSGSQLQLGKKNGGAILIVTHSDAIAKHADRIIRIEDGKIVKNPK